MSLYIANAPLMGNYNEAIGLDIDEEMVGSIGSAPGGDNYYDYDMISKPNVGRSGSGIIIPPSVDDGFPSVGDYIINPDGSKRRQGMARVKYKKDFLSDDQSATLDTMVETVNNGRLGDVKVVKDITLPTEADIVIKKDNQDTSIKGILEQNSINDIFFSDMNMKGLQNTIRYKVHANTQKVISDQSQNELYVVMRSIMLQFANFRVGVDNIVDEIKRLNQKVIEYYRYRWICRYITIREISLMIFQIYCKKKYIYY